MDKDKLIILALQERIGELTAEYERKIADVRAEYTLLAQRLEAEEPAGGEE